MTYLSTFSIFFGLLSFISVLLSSLAISRISRPAHIVEAVLFCFIAFTGQILLIGYLLSSINYLSRLEYWAVAGFLILVVVLLISSNKRIGRSKEEALSVPNLPQLKAWFVGLSRFEQSLLLILFLVTILTGGINLLMILFAAPFNWDSMTYHLARAAYYIQHGNLNYYDANFWAQIIHPKNGTILVIYTFLASGLNENLTQMVQFVAYWIAALSVYGISRRSGYSRAVTLFSALVFALLIENLMEAITTQNDLLLTAYIGAAVYFLFAFKQSTHPKYLVWAGMGLGIAVGIKASVFLVLPSLLVIAWYTLKRQTEPTTVKNIQIFLASSILAVLVFALPAGYWANYQLFGHPIGPQNVRVDHSFENAPAAEIITTGTKNLLRFGFDFLSLDGLPQVGPIVKIQGYLRAVPIWITTAVGLDLESATDMRAPFQYERVPRSHEDGAFWGVLGFGLIWMVVFLAVVGVIKDPTYRVLSIAALVFWLAQAYSGPYDPWRGRYFITAAIFATPPVGWLFRPQRHQLIKLYLIGIILLGALSAFSAVALRPRSMLITLQYRSEIRQSVFTMDRTTQLVRSRGEAGILPAYEKVVPPDATVALYLEPNSYEYPLFGEKLTRRLIPLNSFWRGPQPVPEEADYLLFSSTLLEPMEKDICTDSDSHCLRNLKAPE